MNRKRKNKLILLGVACAACMSIHAQTAQDKNDLMGMLKDLDTENLEAKALSVTSTSEISGQDLEHVFATNLYNSMIGRLSGLTMTQGSFEAGTSTNKLFSRGVSTYRGSNAPLVLIDGFECSISDLVPQEIESVSLLKDAAATAIYGLRGANGVLLVTTKRGQISPLKIGVDVRVGFQKAQRERHYLDAYQYATLYNEAEQNDGKSKLTYSPQDLERYKNGWNNYLYPNVDWMDEISRSYAPIHNYDLTFSGGDKTVKYFAALNFIGNNGLLARTSSDNSKNQTYSRYNMCANVDVNVTKNFSMGANMGLSVADCTTPGKQHAAELYNETNIPANAFPIVNPNGTYGGTAIHTNPYADLHQTGYFSSNSRTINAALRVTEKLDMVTKGLSISALASFNSWYIGYSNKNRKYARFPLSNVGTGDDIVYEYGQQESEDTSLTGDESMSSQWRNMAFVASLDYQRDFMKHSVLGQARYRYEAKYLGKEQPYRHIGGTLHLAYGYDNRYLVDFSAAYEGSERFMVGHQYGFFPAAAIGWVVSNESFLKGNKTLPFLKVRLSYGLTGNDNIFEPRNDTETDNRWMYDDAYASIGSYPLGVGNILINGAGLKVLGNKNLTWEKEKKLNVGIEANLFGKLDVTADYFYNKRFDILSSPERDIPLFAGVDLPLMNVGKVENQGFELMLKFSDHIGKNFNYFIEFNSWFSKNKIEYNSEAIQTYPYQYTTGRMIDKPYLLIADGFYSASDIADPNVPKPSWSKVQPGDLKYKDMNHDGKIDQTDSYPVGETNIPKFTGMLNLGASFHGFDVLVSLYGVAGRSVYLGQNYFKAFQNHASVSEIALGRWTEKTAETATYPRLTSNPKDQNNFRQSTFWQRNGNFMRLQNIEVGYTFKNLIKKRNMSDLRIYFTGNNICSWDHVDYTDPELLAGYPAVATYSIGAKFNF